MQIKRESPEQQCFLLLEAPIPKKNPNEGYRGWLYPVDGAGIVYSYRTKETIEIEP